MERLLAIPAEQIHPVGYILSLMPFPEGPEMIVEVHLRAGRKDEARQVLEAASTSASEQNRSDWVERFVNVARAHGLPLKSH